MGQQLSQEISEMTEDNNQTGPSPSADKKAAELRRKAEKKMTSTREYLSSKSGEDIENLVHELQVHQIELEMQNEELQKTQRQLEESRDKYSNLFNFAPVGYFTCDEKGIILELNLTMASQLGIERKSLHKKNFHNFIPEEDRDILFLHLKEAFKTKTPQTCELKLTKKDETTFFAQLESIAVKDDTGDFSQCRTSISDITELKKAEELIRESLKEKELLLGEIHHRVNNNMQVISSLLNLQQSQISDKKYADIFKDNRSRIRSMAIVHNILYQSNNFAKVDFHDYIDSLIKELFNIYGARADKISIEKDVKDILIGIDNAIPCGLIINELLSNSLKHAFPKDRKGRIKIAFHPKDKDEYELVINDNGKGIPENLDIRNTKSLGLKLVTILAEDQLNGKIELRRSGGTNYNIRFKRSEL